MSEDEFWNTTPLFTQAKINAQTKREQTDWERARMVGYLAYIAQDRKKQPKITEMVLFPWEKSRIKSLSFSEEDMSRAKKFHETDHSELFAMIENNK